MTATDVLRTAPPGDHAPPPSACPPTDRPARALTAAECAALIAGHDEARLGYETGRGHRCVVVGYAAGDADVVLVLPEHHPATGYLPGARVTLEVEAPAASGWQSARVTAVAYAGDPTEASTVRPPGAVWPSAVAAHVVHVPLAQLEGTWRAA